MIRIARFCDHHGLATREGLERAAALEAAGQGVSRRAFLAGAAKLGVAGVIGTVAGASRGARAAPRPRRGDVAIVGAGLAGLACADELRRQGLLATVYEASERSGGRCFSLGGAFPGPVTFPGQVVERGGEFIDTAHKTMIGYTRRFGLALEDVTKGHGDVFYHFFGQRYSESEIVDELRALVDAMRDDLRTVGEPTADRFTPADVVLDRTNLKEYLETRGAGSLIKAVLDVAYTIEYGLEIDRQDGVAVGPARGAFEEDLAEVAALEAADVGARVHDDAIGRCLGARAGVQRDEQEQDGNGAPHRSLLRSRPWS